MSRSTADREKPPTRASQLTLRVRHPDCWTLEATAGTDGGLVAHGVYHAEDLTSARCTAYADSGDDVEELIAAIGDSPLTDRVKRVREHFEPRARGSAAGNATTELLVEYRSHNSIHEAFVGQGFVPEGAIRVQDGEEHWTVIITRARPEIRRRLDAIRTGMDAGIAVEGMRSPETGASDTAPTIGLSERQREVFRLAQREGYYRWPRGVSADDLATELDLSKTTVLEHLRKAEAKLLGPL